MSVTNGQPGFKPSRPNSIEALGIFLFSILYLIFAGPIISAWFGKTSIILLTLGLGLVPILYSLFAHHDFKTVFIIRKVQKKYVLGGLFLSMGMFICSFVLSAFIEYFFPEAQKLDYQFLTYVSEENIILVIIAVSLFPAICEEIMFRGFILSGLQTSVNETVSIIICGIMFGLMHLEPYKIPLTILIGIGLSFAAKRSGSIFIPIFMHGLHNFMLLIITRYYYRIFAYDFFALFILMGSLILIYIGVRLFTKKPVHNEFLFSSNVSP